tara:strand:- start:6166 stop:6735 length:570 start_codon:yes stop_codon:yes gene_type:complete
MNRREKVKDKLELGALVTIFILSIISLTPNIGADELVHEFKNPSFSGIGTSAHYLTVENQEKSRRDAIKKDIEAALKQAERDAENTTLAKFMRNLESRIYAQLSKQLVEKLFETCTAEAVAAGTCTETTFGSFVLEGNTITYQKTICDSSLWACTQGDAVIVMTIVAEDGTETQIVIPIGAGTAGSGTG